MGKAVSDRFLTQAESLGSSDPFECVYFPPGQRKEICAIDEADGIQEFLDGWRRTNTCVTRSPHCPNWTYTVRPVHGHFARVAVAVHGFSPLLRGTIGLAVPGIEIHLPISSELSLSYTCPTIGDAFEAMQQNYRSYGGLILEEAFCYLRARNFGLSMKLQPENARFHNSLQIINAERFVIASRNDFADAADIVAGDPKVRIGRRFGMN